MGMAHVSDHTSKGPNKGWDIVSIYIIYDVNGEPLDYICIDTSLDENSYTQSVNVYYWNDNIITFMTHSI